MSPVEHPKCKVWFCDEEGYSTTGYCPRHQRQVTRTGDPLAGRDAQLLSKVCLRLRRVLRGIMEAAITVDHNDIVHCHVCGGVSAPHGNVTHKEGCAAREAKEILLSPRSPQD